MGGESRHSVLGQGWSERPQVSQRGGIRSGAGGAGGVDNTHSPGKGLDERPTGRVRAGDGRRRPSCVSPVRSILRPSPDLSVLREGGGDGPEDN